MSNNVIIVNIQNPCDEKWNKMQPHDRGKFCMQCSKEVIDFTKLDNKEIIQIIKESNGRICGRMSISQLNNPIEIPSKKSWSKVYKALTAIFLIGSTGSLFATNLPLTTNNFNISKDESNYKRINLKQIKKDSLKDIIKGQVLTEFEEPIPDAIINVEELYLSVKSDEEGNFSIVLPDNFSLDYITLNIEHEYYVTYSIRVFKKDLPIERKFYLNEEVVLMGDIMITYKPKWWQFWKRF
ncbi:carboxypeptidase-like regulatory domain-containing protein [Paenimyroides aestuarii]|uniref:Carboxypeptidase-like regulatory domain-containing protein n=1 Tax=Paenimyroides aestuarii TaxID=2968490 RepID=A0ABY5NS97_9FLAO|nr:carboxypeptidase-like regulatory domain-containing protein [Paenimyroides aestuarii]UUV21347.1 carboxypeptidase-like regulatory domain-containing protein [Paenimyroides aestuarii]